MPLLTIAIPTYNRAPKVDRLLGVLVREILKDNLQETVDVLVSDNASTDDTQVAVCRHQNAGVTIRYLRQSTNRGFDGNLLNLYAEAQSRFIWWMGSDDVPTPGAVNLVLGILGNDDPDMITGSFRQPGTGKVFNFDAPVVVMDNCKRCLEYVFSQQKISSQILRRDSLDKAELMSLAQECGNGWMHFALAFTMLGRSTAPRVAFVSDYLAVCDEDYNLLEWTPDYYLNMHKTMGHPFVARTCPELAENVRKSGYRTAIGLCFAVKTGKFRVKSVKEYDKFIGDLEWRFGELLKYPGILLRLAAIKSHTAGYFGLLARDLLP